jgi:hypothetical protein
MKLCTFILLERILSSNYVLYLSKNLLSDKVFIKDMNNEQSFSFVPLKKILKYCLM